MKVIEITDGEYTWQLPLEIVAKDRAAYYAKKDSEDGDGSYDDLYKAEFEHTMTDDYDGIDWYQNNMNWVGVKDSAKLIKRPEGDPEPSVDAEYEISEAA